MIKFENINKKFGEQIIFDHANLTLEKTNHIYGIIGKSGSGKSTLLHMLFGLDNDYEGKYILDDYDMRNCSANDYEYLRTNKIQLVYQDFKLYDNYSVLENLKIASLNQTNINERIDELLETLDLSNKKTSYVNELSGGEKQRVAIARALINKPQYLLFDEPTGNLDNRHTAELMDYLIKLKSLNVVIIIVTHDNRVSDKCDTIITLENHKLNKTNNDEITSNEVISSCKTKHTFKQMIRFNLLNIKDQLLGISFRHLLQMLIIVMFIILVTGQQYNEEQKQKMLFSGISKNAIVINEFNNQAYNSQEITSIEGVDKIIELDEPYKEMIMYKFVIEEEAIPEKVNEVYKGNINRIEISSKELPIDSDIQNNYNPDLIEITNGSYPTNDKEILIPDIYLYYAQENNLIKDNKINLSTFGDNGINKYDYKISGVYKTNYEKNVVNTIYIYFGTDHKIENIDKLLIITKEPDNAEINNKIESMFIDNEVQSQYTLKHGELHDTYTAVSRFRIIKTLVFALAIAIIFLLINLKYYKSKNRDIAILYSLGYNSKQLILVNVLETIILTFIDTVMAFILIYGITNMIMINTTEYSKYLYIFTLDKLFGLMLYSLVMSSLCSIACILLIKKNKLIKYLKQEN